MGFGYGSSAGVDHAATAYNRETGARVGQVFTTDMAAHVWAQGRQTFGRSHKGVVYFHGRALFDYGEHYCAAYIMPDGAALSNASSPSPTTSGHVSTARYAFAGRVYNVPDLTGLLAGQEGDRLRVGRAYSGEEEPTREFESAIDERLGDREHVRAYCERNALAIVPDALQYLLARVGLPNSADKIRRNAESAKRKADAKAERERRDKAIQFLREFATAPDLIAFAIESEGGFYHATSAVIAKRVGERIRKARRHAGKANVPPTYWREAWERLGELDSDDTRAAIDRELERRNADMVRRQRRRALDSAKINWHAGRAIAHTSGPDAHGYQRLNADMAHARTKAQHARHYADVIAAMYPTTGAAAIASLRATSDSLAEYETALRASDAFQAARTEWESMAAERMAAERAERERQEREALATWRAGGDPGGRFYAYKESGAAYIRATGVKRNESGDIVGGRLETSKGAEVPLVQAVRAFRFIKLVRARGTGWHANGAQISVGHFRVDSIDQAGNMKAACHSSEWADIKALAESLGVFELEPSDSAIERQRAA